MLSDLRKKKIALMFRSYDATADGVISKDDLEKGMTGYLSRLGIQPGTPEYERAVEGEFALWGKIQDILEMDDDGQVTLDEFIAGMDRLLAKEEEFVPAMRASVQAFLRTKDTDQDGRITKQEYTSDFTSKGSHFAGLAAPEEWEHAFQKMDLDGSGHITEEELQQLTYDFYYSDDPEAPGNWLLGPLK